MTDAQVPTQVAEPVEGTQAISDPVGEETPAVQAAEEEAQAPTESKEETAESKEETTESKEETAESKEETTESKEETTEAKEETTEAKEETTEAEPAAPTPANAPLPMLETTAREKSKQKFNPDSLPVTDDPVEIRKQVEFYFSDGNLPQDQFLYEKTGGPENKPVKVEIITSFRRMKRFQPTSAIVPALRQSDKLVIEGPEGEETIRRAVPYETGSRSRFEAATVYVKGFGDEEDGTQVLLEKFFDQFDGVDSVRMRREYYSNVFKGSVWVQFADEELAKKFIALEPKPIWHGHQLMIKSKRDYCQEKTQLIADGKMKPQQGTQRRFWEGQELASKGGRGGRGRRGRGDSRGGDRGRGRQNGRGHGGKFNGNRRDGDHKDREKKEAPRDATHDTRTVSETRNETNGKRAREDDTTNEPPAKKVDTKSVEITA